MQTFIVDAFTDLPFKGNQAAVCFPGEALSESKMLLIAAEFGFSETAFVCAGDKINTYTIRYFSPQKEIPLCGHATLASAKVIFKNSTVSEVQFITGQNVQLIVKRQGEEIMMEFPLYHTEPISAPPSMLHALGLKEITNSVFSKNNKIMMLEISDAEILKSLRPDFIALVKSYNGINGVLITAPGNDGFDYHYRYFWPWAGTNEDPVTGGVQTFLAKYWGDKLNKKIMSAFQSSARTGFMTVELKDDKVLLTGKAVIILEGDFITFDNPERLS